MATFFCRKLFADSRIHKWDRGIRESVRTLSDQRVYAPVYPQFYKES